MRSTKQRLQEWLTQLHVIVLVIVQDLGPSLGSSVDHLLIIVQAFLVLSYIWAHNRPINIITGVILPEPSG
jgi:hypothetical protein